MELWSFFSNSRKIKFWFILILVVVSSFLEVISIGLTLPFLGALTNPDYVYQYEAIHPIIVFFDISSPDEIIFPLTIGFIIAAIIAGMMRVVLLYVLTRFSFSMGADISIGVYKKTLYQDYLVHLNRNSSEIINGVVTKSDAVVSGIISPILTLISSVIIVISIMITLLIIDTFTATIAFLSFGSLYAIIVYYTQRQLRKNGECIAQNSTEMVKSLQEGLGGIRDVLIDNSQNFYCSMYRDADLPMRQASGNNEFISSAPRYVMESIGMSLIAILAYSMSQNSENFSTTIPILGTLALGAQRLLPLLQQIYNSLSRIKSTQPILYDVLILLRQSIPTRKDNKIIINFNKKITLNNLSFRYSKNTPYIFKRLNIDIFKGTKVGIIGPTGSGKSTLIDIIMGLIQSDDGIMKVDGAIITKENRHIWQKHISHVPQSIFLSDGSIKENIAFGIPEKLININRVKKAAKQAQIFDLIESWNDKYDTVIGERGMRLSGGQRQRIGIARALYKQADVIIFDEATSSLDSKIEKEIMEIIDSMDKNLTIIIIAHRITTLKNCDRIIGFDDNGEINNYKYSEII